MDHCHRCGDDVSVKDARFCGNCGFYLAFADDREAGRKNMSLSLTDSDTDAILRINKGEQELQPGYKAYLEELVAETLSSLYLLTNVDGFVAGDVLFRTHSLADLRDPDPSEQAMIEWSQFIGLVNMVFSGHAVENYDTVAKLLLLMALVQEEGSSMDKEVTVTIDSTGDSCTSPSPQ